MKKEKMSIRSHTFKGATDYGYTYEITFNKSLEHTGRMDAMCKGLDSYDRWSGFWRFVYVFIAQPIRFVFGNMKWARSFENFVYRRF